jgi:hypothetical protein
MSKGKIILTDWPKLKYIEANYRGLETEHLQKLNQQMFHLMMCGLTDEAGGYAIGYNYKEVEKELKFRKASLHPAHESCNGTE